MTDIISDLLLILCLGVIASGVYASYLEDKRMQKLLDECNRLRNREGEDK